MWIPSLHVLSKPKTKGKEKMKTNYSFDWNSPVYNKFRVLKRNGDWGECCF